jgi:hypothetical protein
MPKSSATTVAAYLKELPAERRAAIAAMRKVVRANLPAGYQEGMLWGMICWSVPLKRLPNTYNGVPLGYIALGAQKNYNVLHMMRVYGDKKQEQKLRAGFKAKGKKLNMGAACIRFQAPDDLALDVIGELIADTPMELYVRIYESSRAKLARP